jgi:thioredoxin reductase (NADPH)
MMSLEMEVPEMIDSDLKAVAFPKFDPIHLASLEQCPKTTLRRYRAGQKLFEAGAFDGTFYVVKSGEVEILDDSEEPSRSVRIHGARDFAGDISQLTGGPALVSAVARTNSDVFMVNQQGLREILNIYPDLGDTILKAFIARRQLLTLAGNFTGLRVVGSRYSQDTFRVRDFLTRNQVPFTWLDLETDPQVRELLKRFGLTEADMPVARGRKLLLRNPSNKALAEDLGIRRPLAKRVFDLVIDGAGPAWPRRSMAPRRDWNVGARTFWT